VVVQVVAREQHLAAELARVLADLAAWYRPLRHHGMHIVDFFVGHCRSGNELTE
jgi:hypothetical protein